MLVPKPKQNQRQKNRPQTDKQKAPKQNIPSKKAKIKILWENNNKQTKNLLMQGSKLSNTVSLLCTPLPRPGFWFFLKGMGQQPHSPF